MGLFASPFDEPLFEQYLDNHYAELTDATRYMNKMSVAAFLATNPDLNDVNSYNDYIIKKCIKGRNFAIYYALRKFIEYKIEDPILRKHLLENIIKPKLHKDLIRERKYLDEEHLLQIINALGDVRFAVVALIQMVTGARAGDVMRLKKGTIFKEEHKGKDVMRLNMTTKGKKRKVVYIYDPIVVDILKNYIEKVVSGTEYYFLTKAKLQKPKDGVGSDFQIYMANYHKYLLQLKFALNYVDVDPTVFATHDFRRCFARRAWERYMDIYILQRLLGHSDVETTLKYLRRDNMDDANYMEQMQS